MDANPDCAPEDVVSALVPLRLELDAPVKLALELVVDDESVVPDEDDEVVVVLDEPELELGVGVDVVVVGAKVVLAGVDVAVGVAVVVVGVAVVLVGVAVVAVGVAVVGVSLEELEELDAALKSQPASALESHTSALAVAIAAAAVATARHQWELMERVRKWWVHYERDPLPYPQCGIKDSIDWLKLSRPTKH
jgi:hypothetical protein